MKKVHARNHSGPFSFLLIYSLKIFGCSEKNPAILHLLSPSDFLTDNLGNACLTSFFVSGSWDHSKLQHSVKAYQNAVSE